MKRRNLVTMQKKCSWPLHFVPIVTTVGAHKFQSDATNNTIFH
uniref:Uncharacterized protein n=1 Tax=Arundo donax TaxID=35708 RepID=A0A0A8ZCP8_ARUDO